MAGGEYTDKVPGGMYKPWYAPNLTQASTGLSLWSTEDVTDYLKTGRNSFLESFGPMNEVIMNSTRHLSDVDVGEMAEYLKDIPAHERTDGPNDLQPSLRHLSSADRSWRSRNGTANQ